MPAYANFDSHEGVINEGEVTLELTRKSRTVTITNDSTTANLKFKFNPQERFGTLHPNESVCLDNMWTERIYLSGPSVNYRVWAYG